MKNKNLLLFHMESIDSLHYSCNKEMFPNICAFSERCTSVKYHFCNSTSTFMTMNDIIFGEYWYRFENTRSFDKRSDILDGEAPSLFSHYEKNGYATQLIEFPNGASQFDIDDVIWKDGARVICDSYDSLFSEIEKLILKDKFAIYIWDAMSHLNVNDLEKGKVSGGYDRYIYGIKEIDRTFGRILDILNCNDRLDDTVIILFGDHGDDFWYHGFEDGYTHGTPPYANIIRTPLLIFDGMSCGLDTNHVVSNVEIASICKELTSGETSIYSIERNARDYVFSRNLFASQRQSKYGFRLTKSFAVANSKYVLIYSSKGYEMYYLDLDMQCVTNILEFFHVRRAKIKMFSLYRIMKKHTMIHWHFINLIDEDEIQNIQDNFYKLHENMVYELDRIIYRCTGDRPELGEYKTVKIKRNNQYSYMFIRLFARGAIGRIKMKLFGESVWRRVR